jgi:hypothetical protein
VNVVFLASPRIIKVINTVFRYINNDIVYVTGGSFASARPVTVGTQTGSPVALT